MSNKKSISTIEILNMAITSRKYNTLKSKLNKKWTRYLKNKKLFDEYMVYLSNYNAVGAEPMNYKELSILCYNLDRHSFYIQGYGNIEHHLLVNWKDEFRKFAWKSIKWYDIKNIILYCLNKGYI